MRRGLALCLALALMIGLIPAYASAEGGRASTSLSSASVAQKSNIALAIAALNGTRVGKGGTFSFNDAVGPRTKEDGYVSAINGRGAKKLGGGVSQVATTLYLALKQLDGIEYLQKRTYGNQFAGGYVDSGYDAIVTDSKKNVDFRFVNGYGDFFIHIWTTDSAIECELTTLDDSNMAADKNGDAGVDVVPTVSPGADGGADQNGAPAASPAPTSGPAKADTSGEDLIGRTVADDPDILSSAQIRLDGSDAMVHNIALASSGIYGVVLKRGETFSFNALVGPNTEAAGYRKAPDGRGVEISGGGVPVVASALWLAVKDMDDIAVTQKTTYGKAFRQTYVESADDAILTDYARGTDFRFRYKGRGGITIYTYVSEGVLLCEIRHNNS